MDESKSNLFPDQKQISLKELDQLTVQIGQINTVLDNLNRKGIAPVSDQLEILNKGIFEYVKTTEKSSKHMFWLTWALVGAAFIQALATIAQVIISFNT